jgi:hypothetical protein
MRLKQIMNLAIPLRHQEDENQSHKTSFSTFSILTPPLKRMRDGTL